MMAAGLMAATARADPATPRALDGAAANQAMLNEINFARTDPHGYAQRLKADLPHFHDKMFESPGRETLETFEGAEAVKEAIAELEARAPAPPLAADSAIAQAALRLVADQGQTGAQGHVDSRNATLSDRLEAAGVWANTMEEDIAYGPADPQEAVRELIVDDGVPGRAHRKAIFDTAMTKVGFAGGPHAEMGWMWVIDFTSPTLPPGQVKSLTVRGSAAHAGPDGAQSGKQTASNR